MVFTRVLSCSSIGPTACGTDVSERGITDPFSRYGGESVRGNSSMYCSPTADMLRTSARRSAGIFADPTSDIVASTPSSVRVTDCTLPTWVPR